MSYPHPKPWTMGGAALNGLKVWAALAALNVGVALFAGDDTGPLGARLFGSLIGLPFWFCVIAAIRNKVVGARL